MPGSDHNEPRLERKEILDGNVHRSASKEPEQMRTFLRTYRDMAEGIRDAIKSQQWQKAWLLVKERERFCRLNRQFEAHRPQGVATLKGLVEEVRDIDMRCIELLEEGMVAVRAEMQDLNTFKRWTLSCSPKTPREARFVDAEG